MKVEKKRGSMKDYVYQQILEMICSGKLIPGEIFTEGQMIDRFQVSKSPVREALIQLCHEDVLKSIPRCGYQVVQISARNISDLTELRLFLELDSLPRIFENLSSEKLEELHRQNGIRRRNIEDKNVWEAWNNNVLFHLTLNRFAGNAQVTAALERALSTCTRAYAQIYTTQRAAISPPQPQVITHHDRIVEAMENHDRYLVHEELRQDIIRMEQLLR